MNDDPWLKEGKKNKKNVWGKISSKVKSMCLF